MIVFPSGPPGTSHNSICQPFAYSGFPAQNAFLKDCNPDAPLARTERIKNFTKSGVVLVLSELKGMATVLSKHPPSGPVLSIS